MKLGIYIGEIEDLKGKQAIIQPHLQSTKLVMVQFDDFDAYRQDMCLAIGWHPFLRREFR